MSTRASRKSPPSVKTLALLGLAHPAYYSLSAGIFSQCSMKLASDLHPVPR